MSSIKTFAFSGTSTVDVKIQVHSSNGYPGLTIVGMVDKSISESKERISAAINSLGLSIPAKKITVNLSPSSLKKDGSHFDLPIALGILVVMNVIKQESLDNYIAVGEISLDGQIERVNGVLVAAMECAKNGQSLICPQGNSSELALIDSEQNKIVVPRCLKELINHLKGTQDCYFQKDSVKLSKEKQNKFVNFNEVVGQYQAKRGIVIANAGGHNIVMSGHPGTGKSMLASAAMGILPEMTDLELIEVNAIYSIAGLLKDGKIINERPFRAPHHSASMPSIVGGGKKCRPGEITLAHNGILFLDELPEFTRSVLDSMRQPMETNQVTIARSEKVVSYLSNFQLIAAMNPCKCGYFKDPAKQCRKVPDCAADYLSKIPGPIMDRIDIHIEVESDNISFMFINQDSEQMLMSSEQALEKIEKARLIQRERYKDLEFSCNNQLSGDDLKKYCNICDKSKKLIQSYAEKYGLSMRGYSRVVRVARTIADLDSSEAIEFNLNLWGTVWIGVFL